MNRTKRNLLLWAGVLCIVEVLIDLTMVALAYFAPQLIIGNQLLLLLFQFSVGGYSDGTLYLSFGYIMPIINAVAGIVASTMLFVAIRKNGKYFRRSRGMYLASVIIIVLVGGTIPWILLMISFFIPDIVVMNMPYEIRAEERKQQNEFDAKKQEIEHLRKLRDDGIISDEEYKQRLMDIL